MNFSSTTPVETRTSCYCGRHWLDQRDGHQRQRWESTKRKMALMRGQPRVFLSPMCMLDGHVGQVWIVTKDSIGRPWPRKQAVLVCDSEQRVYCINKNIRRLPPQ